MTHRYRSDVKARDRDKTETLTFRDRDVGFTSRDETEMRRWYVSRPRRLDRDHNPGTDIFIVR